MIIVAAEIGVTPGAWALAGITFLVATGLAALSYELLEMPIRRSESLSRHRLPVIGAGLATSVVCALVVIPAITDTDDTAVVAAAAAPTEGFTPVPASFDYGDTFYEKFGPGFFVDCVDQAPEACTLVEGDGPHILLMGDSNAQMLIPGFTEMAKNEGLTFSVSVTNGCPWQKDFYWLAQDRRTECERVKEDAYARVIPALDPDVIIALNANFPPISGKSPEEGRGPELRAATEASVPLLTEGGRELVLLRSMPYTTEERDPLKCLSEAEVVEECRFVMADPTWVDGMSEDLAATTDHVTFVDWDPLVCPFMPICDPLVGDVAVFWNNNHITKRYSESLAGPLADQLRSLGLV